LVSNLSDLAEGGVLAVQLIGHIIILIEHTFAIATLVALSLIYVSFEPLIHLDIHLDFHIT
jgi:hypothetical protein